MRILFINSVVDYGSTGKIVRDLAEGAKDQGHEVLIAYGRHDAKKEEDTFSIVDNISTSFHGVMSVLFGRHGLHSNKPTDKLILKIKEFKPDVINLHNVHGYFLNVPKLFDYLKTLDCKIVWTLHDAWSFSGSAAYFDYHGCKTWDEGCVECNKTVDYPRTICKSSQKRTFQWKKESFTGLKDMTIVTPSNWLTNLANRTFLKDYKSKTIHNGIDLSVFYPQSGSFKKQYRIEDKFVILGVASFWENRKGLQYFIDLSKKLKEDEVLFLVGISEKDKKQLPLNILSIERTNNVEELVSIYSQSDVLLNPTLEDNYPTTNLESISCGTPVITFDTGGSPESVTDKTGFICLEKNLESIRMGIDFIKKSTEDYKDNCVSYAKEHFDKNQALKYYLELFEEGVKI